MASPGHEGGMKGIHQDSLRAGRGPLPNTTQGGATRIPIRAAPEADRERRHLAPHPSGGHTRPTAGLGRRGEIQAKVNWLVVPQAGPPLPATPGPEPNPESRGSLGLRGAPMRPDARPWSRGPGDWPGAEERRVRGSPDGDDTPRAKSRGSSARPHPGAAAGAPQWLTRGSGDTRAAVLPERRWREKASDRCIPDSVVCYTARRPAPSCTALQNHFRRQLLACHPLEPSRAGSYSAAGPLGPRQPNRSGVAGLRRLQRGRLL